MGVLILFDGHEGPVMRFEREGAASETEHHHPIESSATAPSHTHHPATTMPATTARSTTVP